MRLDVLDHGHRTRAKAFLRVMEVIGRRPADDVVKTILYRPDQFGRSFAALLRDVMRGESSWTVGERELMAAVVSRLNACTFCAGVHSYVAELQLGTGVSGHALDEWRSLDVSPALAATLRLLERVTVAPDVLGLPDVERVRSAGVSDAAIVDALYVCFIFNLINRMANAFGFSFESDEARRSDARVLNRIGYRLPAFLLG